MNQSISIVKPAAFLLIKTRGDAFLVNSLIKKFPLVKWTSPVYGPYQLVVYIEASDDLEIAKAIETIRVNDEITDLDARMVKVIPNDELILSLDIKKEKVAVLLINVNYKEELERNVTYNLRKLGCINFARAMWGPSDIVAIIEASDHETMRNHICDEIKVMKGVNSNTTLYCYPEFK